LHIKQQKAHQTTEENVSNYCKNIATKYLVRKVFMPNGINDERRQFA